MKNKYTHFPPPAYEFNPKDNERIIYLCGPHGVGKSTMVEDLKSYDRGRVREQIAHMESLTENMSRQIWRMTLHCVEHRENLVYAASQPENSVVIGDRCYLDDQAYISAFEQLGWMTPEQCQNIFELTDIIYKNSNTPKPNNFIILLPPLDWNIERIKERWNNGERFKWCEENFDYLKVVRSEFEKLSFLRKNVLTIRDTSREKRVHRVKEWLIKNKLDNFIVEGRSFVEGVKSKWSS